MLGLVSFFTDVSGEMIYPLLPLFLTQVLGAGAGFLGVIEGFAESVSAFLKLTVGTLSDRVKNRPRWVLFGYSLSSISRPLMGLVAGPWSAFAVRFVDRIGKGIRTSPRDALIADSAVAEFRGKAYGFHRGMDHAGAVVGPLIATALLTFFIKDLRKVFLLASIPAAISVLLIIFFVRETASRRVESKSKPISLTLPPKGKLRSYLMILFLFLLSNASDAFLLLRLTQVGVPVAVVPLLWTALHIVKTFTAMPLGALSDRLGRRKMIFCGWIFYALTYAGFAFTQNPWVLSALFVVYGFYYGLTEGAEGALMADLSTDGERGKVFGWYNFVEGIALLPANLIFGFLWHRYGAQSALLTAALIAALAAFLLLIFIRRVPSAVVVSKSSTEI